MNSTTPAISVERYVVDTVAIIRYFEDVFEQEAKLSRKASRIIEQALVYPSSRMRLSIPSIVFVEIFEKWLSSEEFGARFYYEVFLPISRSPSVEIRSIDKEVLENVTKIGGVLASHDLHDKIVVATAIALECPIITSDGKIETYVSQIDTVPYTIS